MPPIVTKTPDQMDEVADILGTDQLLVSRAGVPLGVATVDAVRTAIAEDLAAEFADEDLATALAAAQISTDNAAATAADMALASAAADRAVLAAASKGSYPNSAATVVPKGVTGVVLTAPGAGYTNGVDYVGTFTGGAGTGARFLFDVVGGAVTNIHGIEPGYGYTANPTPVFTAAPGGAGAVGTATASHLVLSGQFYWAASADAATERMYQNVAGVATAVVPAIIRPYAGQVPTAMGANSSILWTATPEFSVTGVGQKFRGIAPGNNGAGQLQIATAGLFGGAYTPVILPSGLPVPQSGIKLGYPMEFTPAVIGGVNYLVLTFPTVLPENQVIRLEWMGALGYTDGAGAIAAGNTLVGATSGASAVVISVPDAEAAGTGIPPAWDGTRSGTLYVAAPAAFVAGEDLLVGGVAKAKATGPVSTSASLNARIASPNQVYPSTLVGPELVLNVPHVDAVGSKSLKVYANDGVTVLVAPSVLRAAGDVTLPTTGGLWGAAATLRMGRILPSGRFNLATGPDIVTLTLSKTFQAMDEFGLVPSVLRPVHVRRPAPILTTVDQFIPDARYADILDRSDDDFARLVIADMGPAQQVAFSPTLNSLFARLDGENIQFANHQFHDLIGSVITETGHVPSINDTVLMTGEFGLPVNPSNFSLSGPGHAQELPLTLTQVGVTNDATTGNVDVASADLKAAPIGPLHYGKSFASTYTGFYKTPSGKIAFHVTRTLTCESAAGHDVRNVVIADPTHASVNCVPALAPGGYAGMFALRGRPNRLCAYIDGAPQGEVVIGARNGSTLNLGNCEMVEVWNSARPTKRARFTNNAGGDGAGGGWSHWEDTGAGFVKVPRAGPVICIQVGWGKGKIYFGMYEDQATGKDMSTTKIKTDFSYAIVYGPNPAVP